MTDINRELIRLGDASHKRLGDGYGVVVVAVETRKTKDMGVFVAASLGPADIIRLLNIAIEKLKQEVLQ